jgi:hypothetical protein
MHAPLQVIFVPVPVATTGYLRRVKKPWPMKPRPSHWPMRQQIPTPAAQEAIEGAKRLLEERRALRQTPQPG